MQLESLWLDQLKQAIRRLIINPNDPDFRPRHEDIAVALKVSERKSRLLGLDGWHPPPVDEKAVEEAAGEHVARRIERFQEIADKLVDQRLGERLRDARFGDDADGDVVDGEIVDFRTRSSVPEEPHETSNDGTAMRGDGHGRAAGDDDPGCGR